MEGTETAEGEEIGQCIRLDSCFDVRFPSSFTTTEDGLLSSILKISNLELKHFFVSEIKNFTEKKLRTFATEIE